MSTNEVKPGMWFRKITDDPFEAEKNALAQALEVRGGYVRYDWAPVRGPEQHINCPSMSLEYFVKHIHPNRRTPMSTENAELALPVETTVKAPIAGAKPAVELLKYGEKRRGAFQP